MNVYAYLIKDYLEAIPLLEYALGCCLQAWGVRNFAFVELNMSDPTSRILKRALGPRP